MHTCINECVRACMHVRGVGKVWMRVRIRTCTALGRVLKSAESIVALRILMYSTSESKAASAVRQISGGGREGGREGGRAGGGG